MANPRICKIPDCGKPHDAQGYCQSHYGRWRRHGDPLAGGTEHGGPERYFHEVVLTYDGDECLIWPFARIENGYGEMRVDGRTEYVHRRVCQHTHGASPSPLHEAAHSCGRGHDGCVTKRHLAWKTVSENQMDRVLHGTSNRGERMGSSKLTGEDVRLIRSLVETETYPSLAKRFGVSKYTIKAIKQRRIWGWLD